MDVVITYCCAFLFFLLFIASHPDVSEGHSRIFCIVPYTALSAISSKSNHVISSTIAHEHCTFYPVRYRLFIRRLLSWMKVAR